MSRSEELRQEIRRRASACLEALSRGDSEGLASALAEDVVVLLPDRPSVEGRADGIEALLQAGAAGGEIDEIEVSGDLAFVRWREPADAEEHRGLAVWARERAGSWKLTRWIENRGERPSAVPGAAPAVAAPSGPGFRLALLGHPRVTVSSELAEAADGEPEVRWPFQRALEILAFLALARDFEAAREEVVEAVWAEESEESVEKNFHPSVSHLRGALGRAWLDAFGREPPKPVLYEGGLYRLHTEVGWWIDAVEVGHCLEQGRKRHEAGDVEGALRYWEAGLGLYRGPLLQGLYSPWTSIPRDRAQRIYVELLEASAQAYAELDRLTEAMDAYRRILFEDPLRERVHVALLKIYGRQGRRDLVRRQYDRLTALLQEELGVQPLPQTTEEYHRVMG